MPRYIWSFYWGRLSIPTVHRPSRPSAWSRCGLWITSTSEGSHLEIPYSCIFTLIKTLTHHGLCEVWQESKLGLVKNLILSTTILSYIAKNPILFNSSGDVNLYALLSEIKSANSEETGLVILTRELYYCNCKDVQQYNSRSVRRTGRTSRASRHPNHFICGDYDFG